LDKQDLNPRSEAFEAHEKQKGGLELLRGLLAVHYPVPEGMRLFVLYSQLNQAEALKTAVTHWRSRMFKTSGCLIWQLNDCWPVISWSLIDYGLNPKASYFFIKRAFRPIIAPLIVKEGKVYCFVVNETSKHVAFDFKFEVLRFNGEVLHTEQKMVQSAAYTSQLVLDATLDGFGLEDDCVLAVTLESNGVTLYEDSRTVREPKELKLPKPQIQASVKRVGVGKFEIALHSMVYAKAVNLTCGALHGNFDDNFFDLLPNKPKTVICQIETDSNVSDLEDALKVEAYPYL
jgi:beta-mannosidase